MTATVKDLNQGIMDVVVKGEVGWKTVREGAKRRHYKLFNEIEKLQQQNWGMDTADNKDEIKS